MKLSRRGKRTKRAKCTKRTKNIKCRRNTKRHLNKYKRKNTYRKHSHKLRKNKRVMRGGDLVEIYKNENVELEYSSGTFSSFRNMLGKKKGIFFVELKFISSTISENNSGYGKITLKGTIKDCIDKVRESNEFNSFFIPDKPDTYSFTLIMIKDGKTLEVEFVVSVKKYNFRFHQKINGLVQIDLIGYDGSPGLILGKKKDSEGVIRDESDGDGITYSSGEILLNFDPYKVETIAIVKKEQGTNAQKKYTFPIKYRTTPNYNFFNNVYSKMIEKVTEDYKNKLLDLSKQLIKSENKSQQPSQQPPQQLIVPTVNDNPDEEPSESISVE